MKKENRAEKPLSNSKNRGYDPKIAQYVEILRAGGIDTFESCQGGEGHTFPEGTVSFNGSPADGFRALAISLENALNPFYLRRVWRISSEGELEGPWGEITFFPVT